MSRETVETIIGKAVVDGEFRAALFANPDQVLAGYDLTEEEIAGLKAIDAESMESLAGTLDERISKSLSFGMSAFSGGGYTAGTSSGASTSGTSAGAGTSGTSAGAGMSGTSAGAGTSGTSAGAGMSGAPKTWDLSGFQK